jgi:hypothetical protein
VSANALSFHHLTASTAPARFCKIGTREFRFEYHNLSPNILQLSHVIISESAMPLDTVRHLAFNELKLLSSDSERVQVTRHLIGRSHSFENYTLLRRYAFRKKQSAHNYK